MTFNRPLSLHLALYKCHFTSVMSIFHRFCGLFCILFLLYSSIFLVFSLSFISFNIFYSFYHFFSTCKFFIFLFCFLFFYHITNGIRHIFWDFCLALDIYSITLTSYIVFFTSLIFVISIIVY